MGSSRRIAARFGRLTAVFLVLAGVLGGALSWHTASAQDATKWAYVYVNDYTSESAALEGAYQFNSTGGENTVARTGTGTYTVTIPGLAKESQTQLTTLSENGERCTLAETVSVTGTLATAHTVTCVAIGGEPVDIGFLLLQNSGGLVAPSAYLWANEATSEAYTPDPRYQYNSSGEQNTITRTEPGVYIVTLPGQGTESGNIQVTAMNSGPGISCELRRWSLIENNGKTADVYCFDSTGTLVDAGFGLLYVDAADTAAVAAGSGAYLIADHSSAKERYSPGRNFQFSSAGTPGDSLRHEVGSYTVYLPEIAQEAGSFNVTASGGGNAVACSIPRWGLDGTTMEIDVICFDGSGAPVDSFFNLSYLAAAS